MNLGLSVIIRNEKDYKRLQEFLGKEILYIDWQPLMAENKTGIVIFSNHKDFSIGTVGDAVDQSICGLRTIEFSEFFTTHTPSYLSAEEILRKYFPKPKTEAEKNDDDVILKMIEECRNQPTKVTHQRPPKEEAERLFHWMCLNTMSDKHDILVVLCEFINYTISALQLRGLDTTYEEEVLTILKGM